MKLIELIKDCPSIIIGRGERFDELIELVKDKVMYVQFKIINDKEFKVLAEDGSLLSQGTIYFFRAPSERRVNKGDWNHVIELFESDIASIIDNPSGTDCVEININGDRLGVDLESYINQVIVPMKNRLDMWKPYSEDDIIKHMKLKIQYNALIQMLNFIDNGNNIATSIARGIYIDKIRIK